MAFVVAKIIGDGKSPDTAFRTIVHEKGIPTLTPDYCPRDPNTGECLLPYAIIEVADEHLAKLDHPDCYVIPEIFNLTTNDKTTLATKLAEQNCNLDVSKVLDTQKLTTALTGKLTEAQDMQVALQSAEVMPMP